MDKEIRQELGYLKQVVPESCKNVIALLERYLEVGMPEEDLAELEHEKWAEWMKWIWEKCPEELSPDGNNGYLKTGRRLIPKWAVDRWERQMLAAYKDLSDEEKESDRIEARKSINKYRLWLTKRLENFPMFLHEKINEINNNKNLSQFSEQLADAIREHLRE